MSFSVHRYLALSTDHWNQDRQKQRIWGSDIPAKPQSKEISKKSQVRKTGEAVKSVKHNKQKLRDRQQGKGNHNQDESWDEVKSHLTRHTGIRNILQLTSRLNTTKSEMKDHFLVEEYISVPLYPAATHDASSFST